RVSGRGSHVVAVALATLAAAARLSAQVTPPPPLPATLTYQQALDLATSRNLGVDAARRARTIREAGIRIAGQRPNPTAGFKKSRDTPHEVVVFDLPIELGGKRARRLELAKE